MGFRKCVKIEEKIKWRKEKRKGWDGKSWWKVKIKCQEKFPDVLLELEDENPRAYSLATLSGGTCVV